MSKAPKPPEETSPPAAATLDAAGDIVSLRMFRLVVELLSFSAAARRLGVQPGTVSKHITALEQRLGARLIQRTTRQLQITEAGDMLYGPCVKILDEIEQVGEDFSQLHGQPAGMLRVSAPTVLGIRYLSPALPALLRDHPRLSVDLVLTGVRQDLLSQGIDVAIRFGEQTEPNVVSIPLARSAHAFVGTPDYFGRCGTPRHPQDLAGHNCLTARGLTAENRWPVGPGPDDFIRVRGNLIADNGEVTRQAALDGLGIAMLPRFLVETDLQDKRLVAVLPECSQQVGIYAVIPQRRHMPGKVRVFVDFLKAVLSDSPAP